MTPRLLIAMDKHLSTAIFAVHQISKILPDLNDKKSDEFEGELLDVCCAMGSLEELRKKLKERIEK